MSEVSCPTNLLSDIPSEEDLFGVGHQRLSDAIAEMIVAERGGRSIALEGGWGSGKSTVIGIVKTSLEAVHGAKQYSVPIFDAWAHEADPLRRTFLESLIRHFIARDWIDKETWDRQLKELAGRIREANINTKPRLGSLGLLVVLFIVFGPFGLALMNSGLSDGLSLVIFRGLAINTKFLAGLILYFGPIVVALIAAMRQGLDSLAILEIASPKDGRMGPDLAFIHLSAPLVGEIEARKSFFELSRHRESVLNKPLDVDLGAWWVCGVPHEMTKSEGPQAGFPKVMHFTSLCFAARPKGERQRQGFDYIDMEVVYGEGGEIEPPRDFYGYSGGGLWQVPLRETEDGRIEPLGHILSGVAFFQLEFKDRRRLIRCHGRRSVYRNVFDAVRSEFS